MRVLSQSEVKTVSGGTWWLFCCLWRKPKTSCAPTPPKSCDPTPPAEPN